MHDHNGVIQQNMVFFYLPFLRKTPLNRLYHLLIPVFVCHDHKGIRITAEYMKLTTQMEKILSQLRHEHIAVFCPKQHSHLHRQIDHYDDHRISKAGQQDLPVVILHPNCNQCRCGIKIDDVFLPHINDLPPCDRHNKIQCKKQHDIKISEICSSALMIHSILKIVVKPDERC